MIRRTTWIFIGLFVFSLVVVFIWSQSQTDQSMEATPTVGNDLLLETNGLPVVSIKISTSVEQASQFNALLFEKVEQGTWILVDPAGEQIDSAAIDSAISMIESARVLAKVESEIDTEIIGLSPPAYKLEIGLENGDVHTILIGDKTPTQDGYYAFVQGGPLIVVSENSVSPFIEMLTNLPIIETQLPTSIP